MPRNLFRSSLLTWVVCALVVLGLLPFVISWYQINRGLDGIVRQTQATHLIVARAVSDRIAGTIDQLEERLYAVGHDDGLYLDPRSPKAADRLSGVLGSLPNTLVVAAVISDDNGDSQLLQLARRSGTEPSLTDRVIDNDWQAPHISHDSGAPVLLIESESARPGVSIRALANVQALVHALDPVELGGGAKLALVDEAGRTVAGTTIDPSQLPEEVANQLYTPGALSGATRFELNGNTRIAAFAAVPGTRWRVFSTQPAAEAETAATEMRAAAWGGISLAAMALLLITTAAARFVIRPIRKLLASQGKLLSSRFQRLEGNEISQLKAAFSELSDTIHDRDRIGAVFLGRYQVLQRLGTGSMGTVFLGWDPKLRRKVALKTVKLQAYHRGAQESLMENLMREATAAAQLNDPHIVTIYDIIGDDEQAFLAMEFVHGESLREMLARRGALSASAARNLARQLLSGLGAAHEAGIIHRDIKPENLLVNGAGDIKLTDFGIAAANLTVRESMVIGTLGYLAPECLKMKYSRASDLFAVGMTLYEALTNSNPYHSRHTGHPVEKIREAGQDLAANLAPLAPVDLVQLIAALTEKDAQQRPQTAQQALAMLDESIEDEQLTISVDYSLETRETSNDQTTTIREFYSLDDQPDGRVAEG